MIEIIKKKKNGGYAILELLFYIAFFGTLSLLTINAMITMAKSFKETAIQAEFVRSGTIMERMSREIKQAYNIDLTSTATDLKLNVKDSAGADKIVEFKFVSPNIQLWDAGVNVGNLNPPNMRVTNISFTQITALKDKSVNIVLSIRSNNDTLARVLDFHDTIVLRGTYKGS